MLQAPSGSGESNSVVAHLVVAISFELGFGGTRRRRNGVMHIIRRLDYIIPVCYGTGKVCQISYPKKVTKHMK